MLKIKKRDAFTSRFCVIYLSSCLNTLNKRVYLINNRVVEYLRTIFAGDELPNVTVEVGEHLDLAVGYGLIEEVVLT